MAVHLRVMLVTLANRASNALSMPLPWAGRKRTFPRGWMERRRATQGALVDTGIMPELVLSARKLLNIIRGQMWDGLVRLQMLCLVVGSWYGTVSFGSGIWDLLCDGRSKSQNRCKVTKSRAGR